MKKKLYISNVSQNYILHLTPCLNPYNIFSFIIHCGREMLERINDLYVFVSLIILIFNACINSNKQH